MGKVVINNCHGEFNLSDKAIEWLINHGSNCFVENPEYDPNFENAFGNWKYFGSDCIYRHDPLLIQCVEELGAEANGFYSNLIIYKFEGDLYKIDEYDGMEYVRTPFDNQHWYNVNKY